MFEASHQSRNSTDSTSLVKGRGIDLQFGETLLLNKSSFDLFAGESLVLIGPSGQGKTSLLKMMAGLIEPSGGLLEFEGENWSELSITQRNYHYRKRGMLFQKNALFDSMTAIENVCFPMRELGVGTENEIIQKSEALLRAVGLDHALNLYPDEMSGGMQKRLGIARAVILKPPILLNDDPVAGLDPITSRKIIELILNLKKESQITVVSVLNDINRAFELATRIVYVADGEVVDLKSPKEAQATKNESIQKFLKGEPSQVRGETQTT
jgi:phospholipid/cholesterol/gamma-HCH transport system ATP-binding protein